MVTVEIKYIYIYIYIYYIWGLSVISLRLGLQQFDQLITCLSNECNVDVGDHFIQFTHWSDFLSNEKS